jgi:hypothetical protein
MIPAIMQINNKHIIAGGYDSTINLIHSFRHSNKHRP